MRFYNCFINVFIYQRTERGGNMKYETPSMNIQILETTDIVRTSDPEYGGSGSGPTVEVNF